MKDTVYLIVSRRGVQRMTKNLPSTARDEVPVRVKVEMEESAFRTPVIEKEVYIDDWREGIDMADVDFKGGAITEEEAQIIRDQRLAKMREILTTQGYTVVPPEQEEKEQ